MWAYLWERGAPVKPLHSAFYKPQPFMQEFPVSLLCFALKYKHTARGHPHSKKRSNTKDKIKIINRKKELEGT